MSHFQTIQLRQDDRGVATLTLNRPEVHNAFNAQVLEDLRGALEQVERDSRIRVLVLRGAGKNFSAGADIEWMKAQAMATPEENRAGARRMAEVFAAMGGCRVPVVGVIQGAALGGGTGLTCAVDIAVAAPNALFGFTEVRLGIVPAVISPYAIRRLGYSVAKLHFLLGDRIDARRARDIGLVHFLADDPEVELERVLSELLKGSPAAQARIKPLADQVFALEDPREFTIEQIAAARSHPDAPEGLSAFLEKRAPRWLGES